MPFQQKGATARPDALLSTGLLHQVGNAQLWRLASLLAGGYLGFHRGKPVPFGNRAPSSIFEARAPGYERASAKIEGGGRGREEKNRLLENQLPLSSSPATMALPPMCHSLLIDQ